MPAFFSLLSTLHTIFLKLPSARSENDWTEFSFGEVLIKYTGEKLRYTTFLGQLPEVERLNKDICPQHP